MSEENARKAFHPGRTLAETLASFGMSQKELAERTGISIKHINEIIKQKSPVTPVTAVMLEYALGISASFWNNMQSSYEVSLAKANLLNEKQEEINLVKQRYPFYTELAKWGYVEKTTDPEMKLENLLSFFGVTSLRSVSLLDGVQYRKSDNFSEESVAAWLRIGEIESRKKSNLNEYSSNALKECIEQIRSLSKLRADIYSSRLTDILENCGVSLIFTPYIKNSKVNGATRWVNGNNPLIQISTRFKKNDILWFTILHELAHILLHGKKERFIELGTNPEDAKEIEADNYAKNALIPQKAFKEFTRGQITKKSILDFASSQNISPDIVSGRLAKEEYITWADHQKHFARRIDLEPISA